MNMERNCDNIHEDGVIEVGLMANIPYFYAFAFERLKLKCTLFILSNLKAKFQPIFYGYPPNGNPLNIDIRFYQRPFVIALLRALRDLNRPYLIHIGSSIRNLYPLSIISSSYRVPTIIEFHGTDVRKMKNLKRLSISLLRLCNKYVYFAGSTPDLLSYGIQMFWLPNPVDPFVLSFECRYASDTKVTIFIPTRFDRSKNVHLFLYRFYQAINFGYINPKSYVLKVVRWGERDLLSFANAIVHKLKENGVDIVVLPLLERKRYFYELCNSDIVVGQFKLGVYGQVELEALAMNKHVISLIDRHLYLRFIGEAPPIHNYNPLQDNLGKDLSKILNSFNPGIENTAGRRYVLKNVKRENYLYNFSSS